MDKGSYYSLAQDGRAEFVIKRSLFIGRAGPCQSQAEAEATIQAIRQEEKGATHNCTAYRLGREGQLQKYDDDGEPQGTAGPPILEVLNKQEICNGLIVVTRYFGGIKLGASGLVRAYTEAAVRALAEARPVRMVPFARLEFVFAYDILGRYVNYLNQEGIQEEGRDFGDQIHSRIALPLADRDRVLQQVLALSHGQASYQELEGTFAPEPAGKG